MKTLETVEFVQSDTADTSVRAVAESLLNAWANARVVHFAEHPLPEVPMQYFNELVEALGTPHLLAEDATIENRGAQRIHQRWMEVRFDPAIPNAYRHSAAGQPLHTDGSYIASFPNATFMFCVSSARSGGETIFLDAEVLVSILGEKQPDLLKRLETIPVRHKRSGDSRESSVIRYKRGGAIVNWNFFCIDATSSDEVMDLARQFMDFLNHDEDVERSLVSVSLQPGDAVFWRDDHVLHGRRPFEAESVSERFIWKCAVDIGKWQP